MFCFPFRMAEGGEENYSSSEDDSDVSLFDSGDDDDDEKVADLGKELCCNAQKEI